MIEWDYLAFQLMETLESDWDYKASRARTSYVINLKLERTARQTEASGPNFLGIPLQAHVGVVVDLDYKNTRTLPTGLIISKLGRTTADVDNLTQYPSPSPSSKCQGGSRLGLHDYRNTIYRSHYFQIGKDNGRPRQVGTTPMAFHFKQMLEW